jgi:hypothetical protein
MSAAGKKKKTKERDACEVKKANYYKWFTHTKKNTNKKNKNSKKIKKGVGKFSRQPPPSQFAD